MEEAVNFLSTLLKEELKNSTGNIKSDMENGSYYRIRKLVSAIRILSDDPMDVKVNMEFYVDTWHVDLNENQQ
ncbi:hypothetical protein ABE096_20800 [Robertmurraya massiliosenegalensis]|uniref:hypothetical protein n=1 Tax=Robertmurraya TaxID=2837507 RepID=UPI0039A5302F